ncbi:MAG: hypothetical protein IJR85_04210 [Synergistaceae bacterium]|nr:hypothetical protein [Synergistaceae bacterium]
MKLLVLCLAAALIFGGCGGGSNNFVEDQDTDSREEQEEQARQAAVTRVVNNVLASDANGVPAVFNYAPVPDSYADGDYGANTNDVNFYKVITNNDLNANHEFVQNIALQSGCGYIVAYSHSGRDLNFAALSLRITTPDNREMVLDFSGANPTSEVTEENYPNDVKSINNLSESEINRILSQTGMTRAELAAEIASDNQSTSSSSKVIYVNATLDIVPEENPCLVLYTFKAPLTGNYEFAFGEMNTGGMPAELDTPLEVRVYTSDHSYSAGDDESFDLTPRDIISIQRLLINSATEFNEYGYPVKWESESGDVSGSSVSASAGNASVTQDIRDIVSAANSAREQEELAALDAHDYDKMDNVRIKGLLENIPFDEVYEPGAGFYVFSGLRSIVDSAVRDDQYSKPAVDGETDVTGIGSPVNDGSSRSLNEKFTVEVIGNEEEHDRAIGLDDMTNSALINYALGFYGNDDPVDLGVVNVKNVHFRYELVENSMRWAFGRYDLKDAAARLLQQNLDSFRRNFGEYHVCGYTWGLSYEGLIEISAKSDAYSVEVCSKTAEAVKTMLNYVNKGRFQDAVNVKDQINRDYGRYVNISVKKVKHSGRSTEGISLTLDGLLNEFRTFKEGARSRPKSDYERLYVSLRTYYDLKAASSYFPKKLKFSRGLYHDVRALTRKIYHTRCYYNALSAIPKSHLLNQGTGREGLNEKLLSFSTLLDEMMYNVNRICRDRNSIVHYYNEFNALYKWYKEYAERYSFYRFFVAVQQITSPSGWSDSDADHNINLQFGFRGYDKSKAVQSDIDSKTYWFHHSEPWNKGPGYAHFQGNFNFDGIRIIWLETGTTNTNHSTAQDRRTRTIGTNGIDWYYKGAWSRRLEVYLRYKIIRMSQSNYPFAGLEN